MLYFFAGTQVSGGLSIRDCHIRLSGYISVLCTGTRLLLFLHALIPVCDTILCFYKPDLYQVALEGTDSFQIPCDLVQVFLQVS